jgi:hypothetical protein
VENPLTSWLTMRASIRRYTHFSSRSCSRARRGCWAPRSRSTLLGNRSQHRARFVLRIAAGLAAITPVVCCLLVVVSSSGASPTGLFVCCLVDVLFEQFDLALKRQSFDLREAIELAVSS